MTVTILRVSIVYLQWKDPLPLYEKHFNKYTIIKIYYKVKTISSFC